MDTNLLLDFNRFVRAPTSLHGTVAGFVHYGAFVLVGVLSLLAVLRSLRRGIGADGAPALKVAAAAPVIGGIAFLLADLLATALGHPAPAGNVRGLEVLAHDGASTMPERSAAAVFAATGALALARARAIALGALLVALLEAVLLAGAGAAYPSDIAAGAGLGVGLALVVTALGLLLGRLGGSVRVASEELVIGLTPGQAAIAGPASRPRPPAPSGAVRLISEGSIRPVVGPSTSTAGEPLSSS